MTIALQVFHSQPIYRLPLTTDEFTITVEADTIEEMSRLWQAFAVPMRLSCVIKVGVVFITPALVAGPPKPPPVTANIAVGPVPGAADPPVLYAAMNLGFAPYPPPLDPSTQIVTGGELVAVGGSNVVLRGAGLDGLNATQVFLSTADGLTEWRVTAAPSWRPDPVAPADLQLILPTLYSNPATGTPPPPNRTPSPGHYRLSVGKNTPLPKVRSNNIPLVIAARIDSFAGPVAGVYTLTGAGFAPLSTTISLGSIDLTPLATVAPGSITFPLPAIPPPAGTYPVGVVVNGIPCLPGPVVTL